MDQSEHNKQYPLYWTKHDFNYTVPERAFERDSRWLLEMIKSYLKENKRSR